MSNRHLRRANALAAALLAVVFTGSALAAERVLTLGMPTKNTIHAVPAAALELGYFADEGITLKFRQFTTAVPVMEAVLDKSIDIGGGGVFPLVVFNQPGKPHKPVKFFYNQLRKFAFEMVVLPESPIKTVADLKGKKLGVLSLTAPYVSVTRSVLKGSGLTPADLQFLPIGENRAGFDVLMSGKIDAYETYAANSAYFEAEGHGLRRLPYDDRISNLLTYSYHAREEMIAAEPKLIAGFGRAIAKGMVTCNVAPEWCLKTFWKYFPEIKPSPENMKQEMARQLSVLKAMARYAEFPPGKPARYGEYAEDAFQNMIDVLREGGELPASAYDPKILYTNDFVGQYNDFDMAAVKARAATLK